DIKDDDGVASVKVNGTALDVTGGKKEYSFEYALPTTEGEYQIKIEAKDIYAPGGQTKNNNDTLTESDSAFWITVDNGAPVFANVKATTPPQDSGYYEGNKSNSSDKKLTVTGKVTDGNGLASTGAFTVKHEKQKSDGTWEEVPANDNTKPVSSITGPAEDGTFTDTIILPKASGTYRVVYTAKDKYNQTSTAEVEYNVDVDPPQINTSNITVDGQTVNSNSQVPNPITDNNVTVSLNVKDEDSGVTKVEYSLDRGSSWKPMVISGDTVTQGYENWTSSVTFDDGTAKTLKFKVTDGVGLTKTLNDISLRVDKTQPTLELKWYQVKDDTSESELYPVSGKTYVNTKNLVIYANYTDGSDCSGVAEPQFKVIKSNGSEVLLDGTNSGKPKPTFTYYKEVYNTAVTNASTETTAAAQIKSFKAVIKSTSFEDGDLYIKGMDKAGNTIRGEWVKVLSLEKDDTEPSVGAIKLTSESKDAYKKGDTYYIRNSSTYGKLTVSGTTTDNHQIDKTELTVTGLATQPAPKSDMNWSYSLDLSSLTDGTTIKIKAYDKAGNPSTEISIPVVFDENKPKVLTGKAGGLPQDQISDNNDTSNPYKESS
ncbi:MAG: hypothetical protein IKN54_01915, partial [Lachnospiraceae bacterium]|nr:hypothetical protein [Lachnospiraceae bacterium]